MPNRFCDGHELLTVLGAPIVDDVVEHKASLVHGVVHAGERFNSNPVSRDEITEILLLAADG